MDSWIRCRVDLYAFFLRCFNILSFASGFYMLLFVVRCLWCASMRARVCVIHWHCTAQLSMFNMEKRYRNKIIIIIIIIYVIPHIFWPFLKHLSQFPNIYVNSHIFKPFVQFLSHFQHRPFHKNLSRAPCI